MTSSKICLPQQRRGWEWTIIIVGFLAASLTILTSLFGIRIGSLSAGIPSRTVAGSFTLQGFYLFMLAGLLLASVVYSFSLKKKKGKGD